MAPRKASAGATGPQDALPLTPDEGAAAEASTAKATPKPKAAAKKTESAPAPRKLLRVLPGFHLHWPPELKNADSTDGSGRGGEGYVVDLDQPFEREWCAGQMHKLRAIPAKDQAGVEAGSIEGCPAAKHMRLKALSNAPEPVAPEPVTEAKARNAEAGADEDAGDVMDPEG